MARDWKPAPELATIYTEGDFQQAAYQLLTSQVLYAAERFQSNAYRIISAHRSQFIENFRSLLNVDVVFNDTHRYVMARPRGERRVALPLLQTLLILVLRKIYDERGRRGDLDKGEAEVGLVELMEAFKASTGRELPRSSGDLAALIDEMRRFGIARRTTIASPDGQPWSVVIMPAVEQLIDESWAARLAAHQNAAHQAPEGPEESDGSIITETPT